MMVIGARLEWGRPFKADLLAAYGPQSGPPAPGGGNPRPPPLVHSSAQTIRSRADSREHFFRILLKIDHNRGKRLWKIFLLHLVEYNCNSHFNRLCTFFCIPFCLYIWIEQSRNVEITSSAILKFKCYPHLAFLDRVTQIGLKNCEWIIWRWNKLYNLTLRFCYI